jgi:hypothetical protein
MLAEAMGFLALLIRQTPAQLAARTNQGRQYVVKHIATFVTL